MYSPLIVIITFRVIYLLALTAHVALLSFSKHTLCICQAESAEAEIEIDEEDESRLMWAFWLEVAHYQVKWLARTKIKILKIVYWSAYLSELANSHYFSSIPLVLIRRKMSQNTKVKFNETNGFY